MQTIFNVIKQASICSDNNSKPRNSYSILSALVAEVGELSTEVAIHNNDSYKVPSEDGLIGEAVDVLLTVFDLIHTVDDTITEEDLIAIAKSKCEKWIRLSRK